MHYLYVYIYNESSIKVLSKWDQILKSHPRSCDLWIEYLNYRQSDFPSFTVNSCIEEYEKCITVLSREKGYVVDCKYIILTIII